MPELAIDNQNCMGIWYQMALISRNSDFNYVNNAALNAIEMYLKYN